MIALEQVRQYLETLGLKQAVEVLDNTLDAAASKQLTYPEMLAELQRRGIASQPDQIADLRIDLRPPAASNSELNMEPMG